MSSFPIKEVDQMEYDSLLQTLSVQQKVQILKSVLSAADRYQLDDLKTCCEEELIATLNSKNMIQLLILSEMHSAEKLKKAALKFVSENLRSSSEDWKKELVGYPSLLTEIVESLLVILKR